MNTSESKTPDAEAQARIERLNSLLDAILESPLDLRGVHHSGEIGSPGSSFRMLTNGEFQREINWDLHSVANSIYS